MNITYQKTSADTIDDIELMCKWDNDEEIQYFIRPNFNEQNIPRITIEETIKSMKANQKKSVYMILCDNIKVGYISIQTDVPYLFKPDDSSAWISICIGEKAYQRMGIGERAMQFLEEKCKELYCNRIELGVFEYNLKARAFYKKVGYRTIGENKNFVYYNGKWHNDIRMEKMI
ncbi:GNAT family N-acetyltransferase [Paludicola sp. MB14-C6]|uniref:GNAT family N-acetyltransferase n=1 Tax=Paludihabitans sp. MB14-C6 TaxID=3070656 RepID=UPI0027DD44A8|nr:GNAT family N-acetyltransferase [Paludicola sp. MB14-C6]WMJ23991.1 GNAT family N-acetyltransferase [Paludicola sp. MB14-C6]